MIGWSESFTLCLYGSSVGMYRVCFDVTGTGDVVCIRMLECRVLSY
jgi:hypothetical protein